MIPTMGTLIIIICAITAGSIVRAGVRARGYNSTRPQTQTANDALEQEWMDAIR